MDHKPSELSGGLENLDLFFFSVKGFFKTSRRSSSIVKLFFSTVSFIAISTKYVKDIQLAEDIAQESFFKAYKSIDSFREESAFYTWLYRITANTAINYLSSKKRKSELLEADVSNREGESIDIFDIPGGESPEDILNANSLREDIFKNMSNLPEEIRTAVTLREF